MAVLAALALVAAAVTALPPAAGAAAPLRSSRTALSSAAHTGAPPATIVVVARTARLGAHASRPPLPSSAASHRAPRHAFRAAPPAGHPTTLLIVLVVPAQAPRAPPCTDEATYRFAVAGGDPVNERDPSGDITVGFCGQIGAYVGLLIGFGLGGEGCFVRAIAVDGSSEYGFTESSLVNGPGIGVSAGGGVYVQLSSATSLDQLKGNFYAVTGSGRYLDVGVGADVFWSVKTGGSYSGVIGLDIGRTAGFGLQISFQFQSTIVQHVSFFGWSFLAQKVWDGLNQEYGLPIDEATNDIGSAQESLFDTGFNSHSAPCIQAEPWTSAPPTGTTTY
jgi:hypothetical protein